MPTLHSIILYNMTRLGCDATNFGVFLFVTILMSNAAYSLGKKRFCYCFVSRLIRLRLMRSNEILY